MKLSLLAKPSALKRWPRRAFDPRDPRLHQLLVVATSPAPATLGRHQKRTDCRFKAVRIETVEQKVIEHYGSVELSAAGRDVIESALKEEFASFRHEIETERKALEKQKQQLLRERTKLLQLHYADAAPLDLVRSEQARIAEQLAHIDQHMSSTDEHEAIIGFNLQHALAVATDVKRLYEGSEAAKRRLLNHAFFKKLIVFDDHVESELAEPYDVLLNPTLRARVETGPAEPLREDEVDWSLWEASYDDNIHETEDLVGGIGPRRSRGRQGLNTTILVGAGGFEPP